MKRREKKVVHVKERKTYSIQDIDVFVMTHNRAEFLEETLLSLLNQTVRPDAITVFDNESTDNTREVVGRYKNRGVHYVRTVGHHGNFLMMQKYSSRPFVVHFHDDNLLHPDYFEKVLKALNMIDGVAGVTGSYTYFRYSPEGQYLISTGYHLLDDYLILEDKPSFVVHKIRAESPPYDVIVDNIGALVYRADYFRKRVSMTYKYGKGDDLEICMSLLDYGKLVTVSDRFCVLVREHPKRDVNVDENSMTLEQAFNWLGLYIEVAQKIKSKIFWRQFLGLIYTQYPYFVKRAVYREIPPKEFCKKVMEHFALPDVAKGIFNSFLSSNVSLPHIEELRDAGNVQPIGRPRFWTLRQIGKYVLPYEMVLALRRFMIRHHI